MDIEFYEQGPEECSKGVWWRLALTSEVGSVFRISGISLTVKPMTTMFLGIISQKM